MNRLRNLCVMAMGLCAVTAWAAGSHAAKTAVPPTSAALPVFGPLDATQLSQVQAVSQAVLAAKGSQRPSAEEEALRAELHGLAGSVDQALQLTGGKNNVSIATTGGAAESADAQDVSSRKVSNLLGPRVASLHERRAAIDSLSASGDETQQQAVAHVQRLSQRVGDLEQSVQEAINTSDDAQRNARLTNLKKQLQPRTLAEWWQDRDEEAAMAAGTAVLPASTPTMTTLTQHRPGLDDLRRRKH